MIRFSADDEYIVTLGGIDKSIFQWKFNFDRDTQNELDQASESIADTVIPEYYLKLSPIEEQ